MYTIIHKAAVSWLAMLRRNQSGPRKPGGVLSSPLTTGGVSSGVVHPGAAPSPNGGNGGCHPGRHRHQTVGTVDITVTKRWERRMSPSPNGGNGEGHPARHRHQ